MEVRTGEALKDIGSNFSYSFTESKFLHSLLLCNEEYAIGCNNCHKPWCPNPAVKSVSEECQTICCNCLFLRFQNGWSRSPHKDSMLVNVTWNYAHSSGAWCDFIRFSRNSFWQARQHSLYSTHNAISYEGNNNCCGFFFFQFNVQVLQDFPLKYFMAADGDLCSLLGFSYGHEQ